MLLGVGLFVHVLPVVLAATLPTDSHYNDIWVGFITGNVALPIAFGLIGAETRSYGGAGWAWMGQFSGGVIAGLLSMARYVTLLASARGRTDGVSTAAIAILPLVGALIGFELSHTSGANARSNARGRTSRFSIVPTAEVRRDRFVVSVAGAF